MNVAPFVGVVLLIRAYVSQLSWWGTVTLSQVLRQAKVLREIDRNRDSTRRTAGRLDRFFIFVFVTGRKWLSLSSLVCSLLLSQHEAYIARYIRHRPTASCIYLCILTRCTSPLHAAHSFGGLADVCTLLRDGGGSHALRPAVPARVSGIQFSTRPDPTRSD